RRIDRRTEVETFVLGLLDQHDGLERLDVIDALLFPLRRNLRLVRPVVELHLRDACDLTHLPEIELDLVEMLRQIDRLQEIDLPARRHRPPFHSPRVPCVSKVYNSRLISGRGSLEISPLRGTN